MNGAEATTIDMSSATNNVLRPELDDILSAVPCGLGAGPDALQMSLAHVFNSYFNPARRVEPMHITTASSSAACIEALLASICAPGEVVIVPGDCWRKLSLINCANTTSGCS